jgi:hypothetical protein
MDHTLHCYWIPWTKNFSPSQTVWDVDLFPEEEHSKKHITPCSSLKVRESFGGTYRFHLQDRIRRTRFQRESCWSLPLQSFSGPSPSGLMTIFYCRRFDTPPTWRARSQYLYPPVTGWSSYTPKHWFPVSSPPTIGRASVNVKVKIALRLAVYLQLVHLGVKPLETHDQILFQLNSCGNSPYVTFYENAWPLVKHTYRTHSMLLKIISGKTSTGLGSSPCSLGANTTENTASNNSPSIVVMGDCLAIARISFRVYRPLQSNACSI